MSEAVVTLVARAPVPIRRKLGIAFGAVVGLLVMTALIGVHALGQSHGRTETLAALQRKVSVYRQLQGDAAFKLYLGTSALADTDPAALDAAVRQLNQAYDFERLEFLARDEGALLAEIEAAYSRFVRIMTEAITLQRDGAVAQGQQVQRTEAKPVADTLVRLTDQLVNRAESDIATVVDKNQRAYRNSRRAFVAFAAGGIGLALVLGFAISLSVIRPVTQMNRRLGELAAGDFSERVQVANRDELGALAANLNAMSEQLGRLYDDVEAASRHKSQFLANMSHEVRTPLNAIIGFSEVLLEQMFGPVNEKQAEYLDDILSAGRHLLLVINDVLDLSKVEAGMMELELSTFSLPALLAGGLTIVRERAAQHSIALNLEVGPDVCDVEADEVKIKQVVLNLLSNAVKFTGDDGRIDLSAHRFDECVQVTVVDNGIGIDPADQDRIFEEFQQAGQREGSGLGLALARRFVLLHGGTIEVESQPGEGSSFTFTLPFFQPTPDGQAEAGAPASTGPTEAVR